MTPPELMSNPGYGSLRFFKRESKDESRGVNILASLEYHFVINKKSLCLLAEAVTCSPAVAINRKNQRCSFRILLRLPGWSRLWKILNDYRLG